MKWFKWRETKWGSYTFAACAAVLLLVVLEHLGVILHGIGTFIGFFKSVIYGLILAYVMDFFVKFLETRVFRNMDEKKARNISVIITALLVVILLILLGIALIPQLVTSITEFIGNWDQYASQLTKLVSTLGKSASGKGIEIHVSDINRFIRGLMNQISGYITENSSSIIDTVSSIGSSVITWVLSFIVALYFLFAKKELLAGVGKLYKMIVPEKAHKRSDSAFHRINAIFSKYIVCEILDALIVGGSNAVFMLIARMPYVALVSVEVGITNLAPTFGPIVGAVIGAFILLLSSPKAVIPFLIFTIVLQTIDGYVIKPKMYGGALSVPSVWILVAIIVLGNMFGVIGILLAIPIAAIITYWLREVMSKYDEKEKHEKDDGTREEEKKVTAGSDR